MSGELDIACVPSNLGAVLYNKTEGGIKLLGMNTLGVLYIVENGQTVQNIEDLKGKTILSSGKDSTPEFVLNYILNEVKKQKDNSIILKNTKEEIAALLGIPRPSLSRELINLRDMNYIEFNRKKITILDIESLEEELFN